MAAFLEKEIIPTLCTMSLKANGPWTNVLSCHTGHTGKTA